MTTSASLQHKANGHSQPSRARCEIDTSMFAFALTDLETHEEHARIRRELDNLGMQISRNEFDRAKESGERLRVDLEAHFAFEELAMARTGYPLARVHCADHAMQLSTLTEIVREIRRAASGPRHAEDRNRLLADLSRMKDQLEGHIASLDRALGRHMVLSAE
jgi:hemerythrin